MINPSTNLRIVSKLTLDMNNLALILVHSTGFLVMVLPGILQVIQPILSSFEEKTVSGLPEDIVLHPMVFFPVLQYLSITISSSVLLIWSHIIFINKSLIFPLTFRQRVLLNTLWSLGLWVAVIILNSAFFPKSRFSVSGFNWITQEHIAISLLVLFIGFPIGFMLSKKLLNHPKLTTSTLLCLISIWILSTGLNANSSPSKDKSKPNVFIIGIDSLRPELIETYMPFLNEELKSSLRFPNSYTPFARTYPSWMSIITGRYPHNNGARFNLSDETLLSPDNVYLPSELKKIGYQTIYASDERRFSNLGQAHGFDLVIGPKTGIRDFILGSFADFPTSNLLLMTPLGDVLFPEIHANRAAHRLYYPEHFSDRLENAIAGLNRGPIFFATHFCLPHWPYTFANHLNTAAYPQSPKYPENLKAVDKQISELFKQLEEKSLLENSIVIFLSDHGESWGLVNTGLKDKKGEELQVTDFGHGMNILSEDSHKVLLAMQSHTSKAGTDSSLRSLVDIAPTLFNLLKIEPDAPLDGHPLTSPAPKDRVTFFESGIVMAEANQENPSAKAVAAAGLRHFQITDAGMLRIKPDSVIEMLSQKQLGVRDSQQGIYYGLYTSDSPEILIADYINNTFTTHEISADFSSKQPLKEFCEAYKSVNQDTKKVCLDDHLEH